MNKLIKAALLTLLIPATGFADYDDVDGDYSTPYDFQTDTPKRTYQYIAESRVADSLKDPNSAQFKGTFHGDGVYCGSVNAKNSLGGFTGFQLWVWNPALTVLQNQHAAVDFNMVWNTFCTNITEKYDLNGQIWEE